MVVTLRTKPAGPVTVTAAAVADGKPTTVIASLDVATVYEIALAVAFASPLTTTVWVAGVATNRVPPVVTAEATMVYVPAGTILTLVDIPPARPITRSYDCGPLTVTVGWTPGGNPSIVTESVPVAGAVGASLHATSAAAKTRGRRRWFTTWNEAGSRNSSSVHIYSVMRLVIALLVLSAELPAQPTVVRAGRLVDPVTGTTTRNQFVVVENGRIISVGSTVPVLKDARAIDLSALTVLPGLIDAHVHLVIGGPVRDNALATLHAGFTTVVDLGARTTRLLRIRDSINLGIIVGPRVLAAGIWVGTKNGVCEFNGIGIDGPDAFRSRVQENVREGADVIKVCVSGWPAGAHARPAEYEIADDALAAVVRESHERGRLVIAHDISLGGVRAGLRAGIDGLAHAAYLDSATAIAVRDRRVFLIPTLASLTAGDTSAVSRDLIASTRLAHALGVPFVFGTDGGVFRTVRRSTSSAP